MSEFDERRQRLLRRRYQLSATRFELTLRKIIRATKAGFIPISRVMTKDNGRRMVVPVRKGRRTVPSHWPAAFRQQERLSAKSYGCMMRSSAALSG